MMETIGERLKRLRLAAGLSQRELACNGVSYAYVSRVEANTRNPSVKALRMIAPKLGCSVDYLETGLDRVTVSVETASVDAHAACWGDALRWGELTVAERAQITAGLEEALLDTLTGRMYAIGIARLTPAIEGMDAT